MIVKSMARKQPSFAQLISYFHEPLYDSTAATFAHNFYETDNSDQIVEQFEHNATFLPKRANGNYLYHEIISLPECSDVPREQQQCILLDLVKRYVELRCPRQLAYGRMHLDKNLHFHLCISANAARGRQRLWLSKGRFAAIQAELEGYKQERYPELGDQLFYGRHNRGASDFQNWQESSKIKASRNEGEFVRRTKTLTQKEQIRRQLLPIFAHASSLEELEQGLCQQGFSFYQRGQNEGIVDNASGKRYRLKTLGLSFARYVVEERERGGREQAYHKEPAEQSKDHNHDGPASC